MTVKRREHLGDVGVDGRIVLQWLSRKWSVRMWLRIRPSGGIFLNMVVHFRLAGKERIP
jgi:hypothetical protein